MYPYYSTVKRCFTRISLNSIQRIWPAFFMIFVITYQQVFAMGLGQNIQKAQIFHALGLVMTTKVITMTTKIASQTTPTTRTRKTQAANITPAIPVSAVTTSCLFVGNFRQANWLRSVVDTLLSSWFCPRRLKGHVTRVLVMRMIIISVKYIDDRMLFNSSSFSCNSDRRKCDSKVVTVVQYRWWDALETGC